MEWISVKDRLPEYDKPVLWYRNDGIQFVDEIDRDSDFENLNTASKWTDGVEITHWTFLPESPIE